MSENSKINIWQEFAEETGGTFKVGYSWISDSTEIEYKNWKIIFDNFTVCSGKYNTETVRVITPIIVKDGFKFEIYRPGFIRKIEKLFGAQDIEIGYPDFDKAFIIKSNKEFKIKALLRNKEIRYLIASLPEVNLEISDHKEIWGDKLPENEYELSYFMDGEIHNLETLKLLLQLFKLILDELYLMNSIS
ncbi:hypothetical protein [Flavobacterium sp. MDT1-60]|uniref:hypothetical protein n=1 Tax=Flavobacterium sp. MDT1-60 TaxID=1979344 RepID=UPI001781B309|nr:hypothetical protein [Flavobacterium sp. MDT1-60]QOG01995.1 hypothetical protein IHE43_19660 [Flavobacterium sp. MDT1-60]